MKKIIREIFEGSEGRLSSKRVFGAIGFTIFIIGCVCGQCMSTLGYISAGLLGLGVTESLFKSKK